MLKGGKGTRSETELVNTQIEGLLKTPASLENLLGLKVFWGVVDEAGDRSRLPRADLVMNGNINNPTAVFVAEACRNVRRAVGQALVLAPIAGQRKKKGR